MEFDAKKFYDAETRIDYLVDYINKKDFNRVLKYPSDYDSYYVSKSKGIYYDINDLILALENLKDDINVIKNKLIGGYSDFFLDYLEASNTDLGFDFLYNQNIFKFFIDFFGLDEFDFDEQNVNSLYNDIFELNSYNGTFGVDQGCLKYLFKKDANGGYYNLDSDSTRLRKYLIEKYKTKYNMSTQDAYNFLSSIDKGSGVCTYASLCNEIYASYMDNEDKFKEDFGFDMYRIDAYGEKVLNSEELLADMYMYINLDKNGGKLFSEKNGSIVINYNSDGEVPSKSQVYLSTSDVFNKKSGLNIFQAIQYSGEHVRTKKTINDYLKSKNDNLKYSSTPFIDENTDNIKEKIIDGFDDNKVYSLSYCDIKDKKNELIMYDENNYPNSIDSWEGGGHSVFIVDVNDRGLVVSSWGNKYVIEWESIENSKENISIQSSYIEGIGN